MFDFVPIESYTTIYFQMLLFFLMATLLHSFVLAIDDYKNIRFVNYFGHFALLFVVLYIGLRPISGVFVDMTMYAYSFERFQENNPLIVTEDYAFYWFMDFCSQIMNVETFFLVCALLYIVPLYILSVKWFGKYWYYSFFILVGSLSFWAYGTNGIRNGMATSFFLFSLIYIDKRAIMIPLLILSCFFHKTMILPTMGLALTYFNNDSRNYLKGWLLCIPISLIFGNYFVEFFANIGFDDHRIDQYFTDQIDEGITQTGFRWDFLLYSATGVYAGWYYLFKKNFQDKLYQRMFNIYLFANAFWVLVIRANFSNRFAYLSWFMLGIIIIYPLLKGGFLKEKNKSIGFVLLGYYAFTYLLTVILVRS
ncbi:EpsG family protein [Flavobacterium sp. NRK F10]|uniref:EpsG family protein n=1 Tax=Flavobacterium sp. NRK F10 TaxID=2954931 RepID=UPI002090ECB8|nr:EpsG family protein [Flavobacterium sp. NRK F10]MCO6174212.1 EpsG family protein [Flavobacterium sp. NRK F10]